LIRHFRGFVFVHRFNSVVNRNVFDMPINIANKHLQFTDYLTVE